MRVFRAVSILAALLLGASVAPAWAQNIQAPSQADDETLGRLSIEQLARIDVTSVSKHAEPLGNAASAVFVITQDDMRRAGVTSLPEALRLATGMQVARFDNHTWAISSRGFNITTANKLAVFIDGRSIYTPFFSGVFWDVQDYILNDIDRIEVIRGAAGTLWGANAVNGVINIITKLAADTVGTLVKIGGGNDLGQASMRYGASAGAAGAYRVYGKYRYRAGQIFDNGANAHDPFRQAQIGVRFDTQRSVRTSMTVQGDFGKAKIGISDRADSDATVGNVLARVIHTSLSGSQLQFQAYYDYTWRTVPRQFGERRDTGDVDLQYRFALGARHDMTVGAGYRASRGRVTPTALYFFEPPTRTFRLASAFVQDVIAIQPQRFDLTVGTKLEHNGYSGFEFQPTVRGRWTPRLGETIWGSVSRAVRMPTRFDTDLRFTAGAPFVVLQGSPDFQSENLRAFELGYRRQFRSRLSLDLTAFANSYKDLRSLEPTPPQGFPVVLQNKLTARTSGAEITVGAQPASRWQLLGGYTFLRERFTPAADSRDPSPGVQEHNDPAHQFSLRSFLNLTEHIEVDAVWRTVSRLARPVVPAYSELTLHFGWTLPARFELSVVGDNLLHDHHPEFGGLVPREEFRRSVFTQLTWKF